jgi:cellulose synthase/poly-beta-1,6-N-acetylglucosamine synthase-like glycosyltransferase
MTTAAFLIAISLCSILSIIIICLIGAMTLSARTAIGIEPKSLPPVSICIPFKNEARNLPRLLRSLAAQTYPGPLEIILIDDGSTDEFDGVVQDFTKVYPTMPLSLIHARFDPKLRLTSKQQALDAGVAVAGREWIVFTDADMQFDPEWLLSLMQCTANDAVFIYGHTGLLYERGSMFAGLQAFQLEFLFAVAYAFHRLGISGSCMGNNIAVRRDAYLKIGGQKGVGYSIVEDRDLFHAFFRAGLKPTPAEPFITRAFTFPAATPSQFLSQTLRWAKGGMQGSVLLPAVMLLLGLQNIAFPLALAGLLPGIANVMVIANAALLMAFAVVAFRATGSRLSALKFAAFYPFLILETVVLGIALVLRLPVTWKGKRV